MNKTIVIIDFSPRNAGNCGKIADYIQCFYKRTNVRRYSIATENFLPCNGCDYECLKPEKTCPNITDYQMEIMDAICTSDMVYMIVPNFCGFPNANFFAFNERSVGYFNGDQNKMNLYMSSHKKFIIVSNTESDTFINAMKQHTLEEPQILYVKSQKYLKKSIAGDILEAESAKRDLMDFLTPEDAI